MSQIGKSSLNFAANDEDFKKRINNRGSHLRVYMLRAQASVFRKDCIVGAVLSMAFSILCLCASFVALDRRRELYQLLEPYLYQSGVVKREQDIDPFACDDYFYMKVSCILFYAYSVISFCSGVLLFTAAIGVHTNHKRLLPFLIIAGIQYALVIYSLLFAHIMLPLDNIYGFAVSLAIVFFTSLELQALFRNGYNLFHVMVKLRPLEDQLGNSIKDINKLNDDILWEDYFEDVSDEVIPEQNAVLCLNETKVIDKALRSANTEKKKKANKLVNERNIAVMKALKSMKKHWRTGRAMLKITENVTTQNIATESEA